MPEPTQQPSVESLTVEVETLRRTNAELVAKHTKDKARIAEMESTVTGLQSKLTEAERTIHDATVSLPLKQMAESISTLPDLFLEQFSKHFKLESKDGSLTLLYADGKPVTSKDGKAVPFEREALTKFLTEGDDQRAKTFRTITIATRASGAASPNPMPRNTAAPAKGVQFGLR